MDLKKEVYLSGAKYYGKISMSCWGDNDLSLFTKYGEPDIESGDTITDGTTSYTLTASTKELKSGSPFTQSFDPVALGIDYTEAGKRAVAYVNVMATRISTAMDTLRSDDISTNQEINKTITV